MAGEIKYGILLGMHAETAKATVADQARDEEALAESRALAVAREGASEQQRALAAARKDDAAVPDPMEEYLRTANSVAAELDKWDEEDRRIDAAAAVPDPMRERLRIAGRKAAQDLEDYNRSQGLVEEGEE